MLTSSLSVYGNVWQHPTVGFGFPLGTAQFPPTIILAVLVQVKYF